MEKNKRKIAWVFGAGASRGAGAYSTVQHGGKIPIPIQTDFWETILRYASHSDRKTIEGFLFRYFVGFKKPPAKIKSSKRGKYFEDVSVEEVFTFLSERLSTTTVSSQLQTYFKEEVWESLIRAVGSTFKRFKPNNHTRSIYRDFLSNHLRTRDALISFNYDTVLEHSLKTDWYYYGLKKKQIPLFKPHGSVNWATKADGTIKVSKQAEYPVIVAPTHLKFIGLKDIDESQSSGFLNSNKTISEIWSGMEKHLKESKAIVFIGYSFPDADLYFSSVLRTILTTSRSQIKIVIVNPDAQGISDRISSRFAMDRSLIMNLFDLKSFCRLKRQDLV